MEPADVEGNWVQQAVELHAGFFVDVYFGESRQSGLFKQKQKPADPAWSGWLDAFVGRWPRIRLWLERDFGRLGEHGAAAATRWSDVVQPSLVPSSAEAWELTCRFAWQPDDDPHFFNFTIVGDQTQGFTVDG